jgi:ribosomal protein S18 acetylase RimI-like enzyme
VTVSAATVSRRPVEERDGAFLRRLFLEVRPELALLPPGVQDDILDLQLRGQRDQYAAAYPNARHEIITVDGVAAGRLIVTESATAVRIVDIAVSASHRGRGIASNALCAVTADAELLGVAVTLSVWSANVDARRLYERLGFCEASGVRRGEGDGYIELRRDVRPEGA